MSSQPPKNPKKRVHRPLTGAVEQPAGSALNRSNMTLHDCIRILDFAQANPKLSQGEIAAYFRKNGFPTMNQSTISRIIKGEKATRAEAENEGNLSFKRPRLVEFPAIEAALAAWVLQGQTKGLRITGEVLREKAHRFAQIEGVDMKEFFSSRRTPRSYLVL
ncbi:hypothetical protein FRC04_006275 [Tulasnella sp. 424]|nr:hypothetical protein FRC04_006275 [Tulasnella sp. 424]KAG8961009.1 hypothetical protein FRC05_006408 [Tulasnella sp. 425]